MARTIAMIAAGVVVAGIGGTFAVTQFAGHDATSCSVSAVSGDLGGPFELLDGTGATVTDVDVIDKPSLIYFGFTYCPDFCPLDMARNAAAVDILADQGIDARPIFISIDPARDTPEIVGNYALNFHDDGIGLTGSDAQVAAASKAYRTFYQKADEDPEYYLMQHTTFTYLTMPETGFAAFFRTEATPEDVAETVACYATAS